MRRWLVAGLLWASAWAQEEDVRALVERLLRTPESEWTTTIQQSATIYDWEYAEAFQAWIRHGTGDPQLWQRLEALDRVEAVRRPGRAYPASGQAAMVRWLVAQGRAPEAVQWARRSLAAHPEAPALQLALAEVYRNQGQPREALSSLRLMDKTPEVYVEIAQAQQALGLPREARASLRLALLMDMECAPAGALLAEWEWGPAASAAEHLRRGQECLQRQDWGLALHEFRHAGPEGLLGAGDAYLGDGNPANVEKAVLVYRQVTVRFPQRREAWLRLGLGAERHYDLTGRREALLEAESALLRAGEERAVQRVRQKRNE